MPEQIWHKRLKPKKALQNSDVKSGINNDIVIVSQNLVKKIKTMQDLCFELSLTVHYFIILINVILDSFGGLIINFLN
jgi:hypothetical protein